MSWKRRSAGSPPTLWWVLIFWAVLVSGVGRLDDVGIQRALGQEVDAAELARLLLEHPDELVADDASLLLRVLDAGEPREEALPRVDHHEAHPQVGLEGLAQQLRFLLAHEPVVHVDAREPVADRAVHQRRRDRRVHAPRQGADDLAVRARHRGMGVHPLPDARDRGLDEVRRRPGGIRSRDAQHEVADDVPTPWRVDHLGMELDAEQATGVVHEPRVGGGVGLGDGAEPLGQPRDGVAVAHPHGLLPLDALEQPVSGGDGHRRGAVLAALGRQHVATQLVGHQLCPVADPQDGQPAAPDRGMRVG